jgi:hypothetical protein
MVIGQPVDVVVQRMRAAAASTPAWRMPPPAILRMRCARAMKSRLPHSAEPTGAPSPC